MENKYNKIRLAICLCMKQLLATNKLIPKKKFRSNVDVTNVLGTKFGEAAEKLYSSLVDHVTYPLFH